jgi:hypothetical protein
MDDDQFLLPVNILAGSQYARSIFILQSCCYYAFLNGFFPKHLANRSDRTPTLDELHKTMDEQHAAKTTDR